MSVSSGSRQAIWETIFPVTLDGNRLEEDSLYRPGSLGQAVWVQRSFTVGGKGIPFRVKE
jgi:hypothetical protein